MATLYDMMDLEKQNGHLVGELKDAKRIFMEYRKQHDIDARGEGMKRCNCTECQLADAWLARNKG